MSKLLLVLSVVALTACDKKISFEPQIDQCMRTKLFQSCMKSLPAGPKATMYNDWDEVVSECGRQAYYQSLRMDEHIEPQCKAK